VPPHPLERDLVEIDGRLSVQKPGVPVVDEPHDRREGRESQGVNGDGPQPPV
jgi:hypothetical protein